MKDLRYLSFLFVFFCLSTASFARTARTICNGSYETLLIWSDSTLPAPGDTIIIGHLVRNADTLRFDGNYVIVSAFGELCSNEPCYVMPGSKVINYGILGADEFFLDDSLFTYGIMRCNFLVVSQFLAVKPGGFLEVGNYSCNQFPDCTPVILAPDFDSLYSNEAGIAYEWSLNGMPYAATSQGITPTGWGTYRVRVQQADGNFTPWSPPYEYLATALDQPSPIDKPAVYPNPSLGRIQVSGEGIEQVRVVNSLGQTQRMVELPPGGGELDLSDLESGIYYVTLTLESGVYHQVKLILVR